MGKSLHVVVEGERWAVKEDGGQAPLALFKTQSEAWERAKALARKDRSEACLYAKNGTLRARNSYSRP